jgi:hypothetical protein
MTNKSKCSVDGCGKDACVEVILYDVYTDMRDVFFEQDYTCPYLCGDHLVENEVGIRGERKPRGASRYPFSNKESAQGFTIYRPLNNLD